VFERIHTKTAVSWTTIMIVGHARLGTMEDAWKLFDQMLERYAFAWNALMAGYVQTTE
jgi:pentatricopeptide repeat protein